ncbi:hypothetical protein MUN84_12400 [Hymenobacter sp. 5516J-16]|uniref:hypothetical protein n=1 Tax=Hymenobacter sp. 5516J-16 TaxID=2932253 RepID=UPI001FD3C861|nr:hypothetical protein [Hymenobacter sp. 5516J-16]UOQ75497.1 hypothetical protein MUN84_12400 [Hymenobacter sp. 5516J-16]
MSHVSPAATAFPNPELVVSYADGLRYVKHRLNSFAHGALKPWAESQSMNYTMVVNLKNSQLTKQTPLLVQRILLTFGFDTDPIRLMQGGQQTYQFLFRTPEQLQLFHAQLSFYEPEGPAPSQPH